MAGSGKDGVGCTKDMKSGHLVTDTSTPAIAFTGKWGICGTFLLETDSF